MTIPPAAPQPRQEEPRERADAETNHRDDAEPAAEQAEHACREGHPYRLLARGLKTVAWFRIWDCALQQAGGSQPLRAAM